MKSFLTNKKRRRDHSRIAENVKYAKENLSKDDAEVTSKDNHVDSKLPNKEKEASPQSSLEIASSDEGSSRSVAQQNKKTEKPAFSAVNGNVPENNNDNNDHHSTKKDDECTISNYQKPSLDDIKSLSSFFGKLGSFTVHTRITHNNFIFTKGDIVSLTDNVRSYFAQIKILIEDYHCEKYAALVWLLPTSSNSTNNEFHPNFYTYGPQEEFFYKIEELKFIMHAPTAFYRRFLAPVPACTNVTQVLRYKHRPKRKM